MTNSKLRFGFPLAIAFAAASGAAVAQQSNQARQTMIQLSDAGIPIERVQVDRTVSYADLDLTTTSGESEFTRRVTQVAKEACEQVHSADPVDLSGMDDASCVTAATSGALKQAKAAIEKRHE